MDHADGIFSAPRMEAVEKFGRYETRRVLGKGGFGVVYLGADTSIDRDVAIKVFRPESGNLEAFRDAKTNADDPSALRARFLNEARVLGSLDSCPYVIGVLDYGETDAGDPYYVMPFMPRSLADRIGRDAFGKGARSGLAADELPRALPFEDACRVLDQLLQALSAAHATGLVHRDVKPANVLLTDSGDVRLADFGIAKVPDSQHSTVADLGFGSRNYMAPEQRESAKDVDARADLHAFGVVAYRVLTGKLPLGRFEDPRVLQPGVSESLNGLVLDCLSADPAQRPGSGGEALRRWRAGMVEVRAELGQSVTETDATGFSGATGTVVSGELPRHAERLRPLYERILALLLEHGEIPRPRFEELEALAAIVDLDLEGLDAFIDSVAEDASDTVGPRRRFLAAVDKRLEESGGTLSRPSFETLVQVGSEVGWDAHAVRDRIEERGGRVRRGSVFARDTTGSAAARSSNGSALAGGRSRRAWFALGTVLFACASGAVLLVDRIGPTADGSGPGVPESPSGPAEVVAEAPGGDVGARGNDAAPGSIEPPTSTPAASRAALALNVQALRSDLTEARITGVTPAELDVFVERIAALRRSGAEEEAALAEGELLAVYDRSVRVAAQADDAEAGRALEQWKEAREGPSPGEQMIETVASLVGAELGSAEGDARSPTAELYRIEPGHTLYDAALAIDEIRPRMTAYVQCTAGGNIAGCDVGEFAAAYQALMARVVPSTTAMVYQCQSVGREGAGACMERCPVGDSGTLECVAQCTGEPVTSDCNRYAALMTDYARIIQSR